MVLRCAGGILARAEGLNAEALQSGSCGNSDTCRLMYLTLFGRSANPCK